MSLYGGIPYLVVPTNSPGSFGQQLFSAGDGNSLWSWASIFGNQTNTSLTLQGTNGPGTLYGYDASTNASMVFDGTNLWVSSLGAASGTFTNAIFINGFSVIGTPGDNFISNNLAIPGNMVAGTYYGSGAGLTNVPSQTTYRSNVISTVLTFPSSSNTVTVAYGGIHYLLVSATPVSFTNLVGAIAGYDTSAIVTVSNSTAANFTNFCTVPNAVYPGQISTNALIILAGKEAEWVFECRGINKTNVYNVADK